MFGKGVAVGAGSTVLYDTHVGDYARLGPLTLVMKGETHSGQFGMGRLAGRAEGDCERAGSQWLIV